MAATIAPDMRAESFSDVPAPPPRRPRVLLTGTVLAGTGAAAGIAGLVALYVRLRADFLASDAAAEADGSWLREAHIELTPGNMAMLTLAMAAITAAAAGWSLRRDDRGHALLSLGTTLMLGAAYLTTTAFAWQQMGPITGAGGLMDAEGSPALLIVVITAAHVAMTAAGMLYLAVMGFKAMGGQLTGRAAEGYNAAVAFWFITVAVYAVVWYTIFVTK